MTVGVVSGRRLPPPVLRSFRKRLVRHPSESDFAWRAWTENHRICLLVAQIAKTQSRVFGATILDVRFFDPEGLPFPNDLWALLPDGTWLQCDLPRDTVSRGS